MKAQIMNLKITAGVMVIVSCFAMLFSERTESKHEEDLPFSKYNVDGVSLGDTKKQIDGRLGPGSLDGVEKWWIPERIEVLRYVYTWSPKPTSSPSRKTTLWVYGERVSAIEGEQLYRMGHCILRGGSSEAEVRETIGLRCSRDWTSGSTVALHYGRIAPAGPFGGIFLDVYLDEQPDKSFILKTVRIDQHGARRLSQGYCG